MGSLSSLEEIAADMKLADSKTQTAEIFILDIALLGFYEVFHFIIIIIIK